MCCAFEFESFFSFPFFAFFLQCQFISSRLAMETESKEGLEKEVTNLFGKILRARVADSRIIEGEFQCVDKDLNVVLSCASEYHAVEDSK